MALDNYNPVWPETTIFWGAGATASLKFPTTAQQGKFVRTCGSAKIPDEVREALAGNCFPETVDHMVELLEVLGFDGKQRRTECTPEQRRIVAKRCPRLTDEDQIHLIVDLRGQYDFDALRRVIKLLPKDGEAAQFLVDLFNILDMHLTARLSFSVASFEEDERETLSQARLMGARNCLSLLINMMMQGAYLNLVTNHRVELDPYIGFVETLAKLMQEEGLRFLGHPGCSPELKEFYLFSYAVISLNFDPVLLWLIFNAHKNANNNSPPYVCNPCRPLKLFNDLGHFVGSRRVEPDKRSGERTLEPWYPGNEAAVQRINDPDYCCGRIARVGKLYFLHGSCCWRECPSCGKLNMHLGDEWGYGSRTLFPPFPLQTKNVSVPRSLGEERKREEGRTDILQCVHCGAITRSLHVPLILQSNFKGNHPSFLEEIARDARACVEKTRHVVLMGYSLPEDDVIYRALLSSRVSPKDGGKKKGVFCSVVVGIGGEAGWLRGGELERYKNAHPQDAASGGKTIKAAMEIFGKENVRAFTGGIPQVFDYAGDMRASVKEILYPTGWGIESFANSGVVRTIQGHP